MTQPTESIFSRVTSQPTDTRDSQKVVPPPRPRWLTRFALPLALIATTMLLFIYVARDSLLPVTEVEVVPVVTKSRVANSSSHTETSGTASRSAVQVRAQAPGWIEPEPYSTIVQPLVSGVVEQVLVLEGDTVEKGQIVATLISEDITLALARLQAEHAIVEADITRLRAEHAATKARVAQLQDEVDRKQPLIASGGVSQGEFARLVHELRVVESEAAAAEAAVDHGMARLRQHNVAIEEAQLHLDRTRVRAPVDGIILTRSAQPGTRLALVGDGVGEAHYPGLFSIYDPAHLQVRADVPLPDSANVHIGTRARITSEAVPDMQFEGEVIRVMHKADIQRNTIQFKVRILNPTSALKPDMLVRVRFLSESSENDAQDSDSFIGQSQPSAGTLQIYAPRTAIEFTGQDIGQVWVVEPDATGRALIASQRQVRIGVDDSQDHVQVSEGLQPGDRLIVEASATLRPGMRVRIADQSARHTTPEEN